MKKMFSKDGFGKIFLKLLLGAVKFFSWSVVFIVAVCVATIISSNDRFILAMPCSLTSCALPETVYNSVNLAKDGSHVRISYLPYIEGEEKTDSESDKQIIFSIINYMIKDGWSLADSRVKTEYVVAVTYRDKAKYILVGSIQKIQKKIELSSAYPMETVSAIKKLIDLRHKLET